MKKIISIFVIYLCTAVNLSAQDNQGIMFFEGSFKSALQKAKQENKLIFVDFYATFCGPCKMMAETTFKEKIVGDYYNENFINLKINVDNGEGPTLKITYDIIGYPTFMFINDKGYIVYTDAGIKDVQKLIAMGEKAQSKKNEKGIEERFYEGDRDNDLIEKYLNHLIAFQQLKKVKEVLGILYAERGNKVFDNEICWKAFDCGIEEAELPISLFFAKDYKKIAKKYGEQNVKTKINHLYASIQTSLNLYVDDGKNMYRDVWQYKLDTAKYEERRANIFKYRFPDAKGIANNLDFILTAQKRDYKKAIEIGNCQLKKANADKLYYWSVIGERLINGKEFRNIILEWAERGETELTDKKKKKELLEIIECLKTSEKPVFTPRIGILRTGKK